MKERLRNWVYSLIFKLYANNPVKRDSIVLGIIIGYVNTNPTRSAVQYLISDLPKNTLDEAMILNGVLMSSYLLPRTEDSKQLCGKLKEVDPNNIRQCKKMKTSFLAKILGVTSNIDLDSLIKSLDILIRNKNKLVKVI